MENILIILLLLPVLGAAVCPFIAAPSRVLRCVVGIVIVDGVIGLTAAQSVFSQGPLYCLADWLYLDALSAYHLLVMLLVFTLSSLFAVHYFSDDIRSGRFSRERARRYGTLWLASLFTMTLTLLANNIGLMWVGMEATTLVTAFLVSIYPKRAAIEAMWKYLIICSVGIAFAFIGTILVAASAPALHDNSGNLLFWTNLMAHAGELNPLILKTAFIFAMVGYGTKAGLAPTHTWLPDAHSQAPGPVSAMFSGFMLNAALYCIIRNGAIVNRALGSADFTNHLYILIGLFSIIVAAAFIISQHDIKRLLAYHSVEHLGIIALGLGLGPAGIFAALFHTLNHSVCKSLSFFAAARLGQFHGSYDMRKIKGVLHSSPLWGTALLASLLALIGVAPFAIFISEFLLVKAMIGLHSIWVLVLFLTGSGVVFVAALDHLIPMAWGETSLKTVPHRPHLLEAGIVIVSLVLLLILGLWLPQSLTSVLMKAAHIAGGMA